MLPALAVAAAVRALASELRRRDRRLVERAAMAERRRIARDLHDGLAQELAFIATQSQRLGRSEESQERTVAQLKAAAERALHESRIAIAVLTAADGATLESLIVRTADTFGARFPLEVEYDLQPGIAVDDERRSALLRILHEALTNAVRHGRAERVRVQLSTENGGVRLQVADEGAGFDPIAAAEREDRLGLRSMRERAEMLGGSCEIRSRPGEGTVVEARLP